MIKLTRDELNKILENHKHFLKEDVYNWQSMRANLSEADLTGANLTGVDLSWANLSGADLTRANLSGANLTGADLTVTNLTEVNLTRADLSGANLSWANLTGGNLTGADLTVTNLTEVNLTGAYLTRANLTRVDLTVADLSGANLTRANLTEVNLTEANLSGANLTGANLTGTNLSGAENIPYIPMICPEEGSFIAYKKVCSNIILKLLIPKEAKRCSGLSRKCRCNKAIVLEMQNYKGESIDVKEAHSIFDRSFKYRIGEIVEVSNFDENRWNECSTGIHFFINRQEAIEYR